jgi:carboxyl-terminal processing protease
MNRRTLLLGFLAVGTTQFCPAVCASEPPAKSDVYGKDVEFLLDELPKRAGRFFELKKIDWNKVSEQFRAEVKAVRTDEEHLKLCSRLIARLRDGHAGLVDTKVKWPDESKGRTWTGPRVHLLVIGDKVYIRSAFGEAESLGVKTGMRVDNIDGEPAKAWLTKKAATMADQRGFSTDQQALYSACHGGLADWSDTPIAFDLVDADGTEKGVRITRNGGPNYAPFGPVHPPKNLKAFDRNACGKTAKGFAYIHLRKIPGDLEKQLDGMLAEVGDAPGLILDMRGNTGGGCDHNAVFGRFVPKGKNWGRYVSGGPNPYAGPMVVILDAGVCSAGETVGGMFKEDGRAYAIGDSATAGMSSSKQTIPVPSGLFSAYVSVFSNKARFNKGRGIEGVGVPPHEVVPYDAKELATGIDTQIRRAEELLTKGFPEYTVDYVPPQNH